jgi:hypothetical protein
MDVIVSFASWYVEASLLLECVRCHILSVICPLSVHHASTRVAHRAKSAASHFNRTLLLLRLLLLLT